GHGKSLPSVKPNDPRREGGSDHRTVAESHRDFDPEGSAGAREPVGYKAHDVNGSNRPRLRDIDARLFDFFERSAESYLDFTAGNRSRILPRGRTGDHQPALDGHATSPSAEPFTAEISG